MDNKSQKIRLQTVRFYLNNKSSLRKTALKLNLHYQTVFRWVKRYKEGGEGKLFFPYKKPWRRTTQDLEQKIVLLKERNPGLTLIRAKEILKKKGIKISLKGIWGIWKRYGYTGFTKRDICSNYMIYIPWTKEAKNKYEYARRLFSLGKIAETAAVLNSMPAFPKNEIISKIPDSFLNLKRRIEKIFSLFGEIPLGFYQKKIRNLYEACIKEKLYYSALRIGVFEVIVLEWCAKPEKILKRVEELKKIFRKKRGYSSYLMFASRFGLLISEGVAYAHLLKMKKAHRIGSICSQLLERQKYMPPYFMFDLGVLYMNLEDLRKAEYWLLKSVNKVDKELKMIINGYLVEIFIYKGEYKKAMHVLKNVEFAKWVRDSQKLILKAIYFLINGMPEKAISFSTKAISLIKKEEINSYLFAPHLTIAGAYCSLGEKAKAANMFKGIISFLIKNRQRKEKITAEILFSQTHRLKDTITVKDISPTIKLALFVKHKKYRKALSYAKRKYLLAFLYRYILFFPETITNLLEKGENTGLPKTMLRLPVFNRKISVYNIKFMGKLVVYKNQKYLKIRLTPIDVAFIINFALKAGEPGKKILLEDIYNNFWKESPQAAKNLSHLLVRVKKALRIPSHLLEISRRGGEPVLVNRGIHFITDYNEFEQTLTTAQALERAGEWGFAKKEFLRAFSLFRGEPFKKMYDNWSENMRRVILNKLETEAIHFAKSCLGHRNKRDAKKISEKVLKIIPGSEELSKMV